MPDGARRKSRANGDTKPVLVSQQSPDPSCSAVVPVDGSKQISGTIVRIKMKNFMCHDHLDVDLNSSVNFITGQNGSGKSAILTGLMIALGSRARATDRAASLKDLVQKGRPSALISVTLRNVGDSAYRPDKYGDAITVDRIITASGSASYCLKSSAGRVVSKERRELNSVLDSFRVQVDNPVAILTQETSKNFLRVDDPKQKYQLFMRATCLEQIRKDYDDANKAIKFATERQAEKKKCLPAAKTNMDKLERQLNLHKNIGRLHEKMELFKRQIQWALVCEAESKLDEARGACEKQETLIEEVDNNKQRCENRHTEQQQHRDELVARKAEVNVQLAEQRAAYDALKAEHQSLREQLGIASEQLRSANAHIRSCVQDRDNLRQEVERVRNIDYPGLAEARREREERAGALKRELQELEAQERSRRTQLEHLDASVKKNQDDAFQLQAEENALRRQMETAERELSRLRASSRNANTVFGPWVADVEAAIDRAFNARKLRKKPIGPLGAYIKLRPGADRWAPLVENCLISILSSYVVDNRDDLAVMNAIIRTALKDERRKPQVICSRFLNQVHDVSRHGIEEGRLVSVWSVLDISHPVVANTVIDNGSVETVLLLETDREARDIMSLQERVPRGCAQALTLSGYQYYPAPKYRTYPIRVLPKPRFLQVSVEEALSQLNQDLQARRADLDAVARGKLEMQADLQQNQTHRRSCQQQLEQTAAGMQRVRHQLRQLGNVPEPETPDLQTLEDEVAALDQIVLAAEAAAGPMREQDAAVRQRYEASKTALEASKEQTREYFGEHLKPLNEELEQCEKRVGKLDNMLSRFGERRAELQSRLGELERRVKSAQQLVEQLTSQATGDRINVKTDSGKLQRQLDGLQRTLTEGVASLTCTRDQVEEKCREALENYSRMTTELALLEDELRKLRSIMRVRDERFEALRIGLGHRLTHYFVMNLEGRRYSGQMTVNHGAGTLQMCINPRQLTSSSDKAPQQLSGGERSFSTLCFILALWKIISSPFHMLDEFDVFMDEVNRKIGHDILLNSALASNNQFVFISPLSLPSAANNPRVSVLRMLPPKRK